MVLTVVGVAFGFRLTLAQSTREINISAYLVNSENKEIAKVKNDGKCPKCDGKIVEAK